MEKILVVIDVQNDFVDGALGTAEAKAIIPAVKAKIAEYRAANGMVFFTRDTHEENYMDTQEGKFLPIPHCIRSTDGHQLHPEIQALIDFDNDCVLDKPTFGSIDLMDEIDFFDEIESIELVGLCTGICVLSNATILKAALPEVPIIVDARACACVTPETHKNAIAAMKLLQIEVKEG